MLATTQFRPHSTSVPHYTACTAPLTVRCPLPQAREFEDICEGIANGQEQPSGVVGEIFRDINRTFPWHPMFTQHRKSHRCTDMRHVTIVYRLLCAEYGQSVMFDALRAFASSHIDVGYCQGMNYIAGFLIACNNPDWKYSAAVPALLHHDSGAVKFHAFCDTALDVACHLSPVCVHDSGTCSTEMFYDAAPAVTTL